MSATAYAVDDLLEVGSTDAEQVQYAEPYGEAPYERDRKSQVDAPASALLSPRRYTVTILSTLVSAQVVWLSALAYGFYRIVL